MAETSFEQKFGQLVDAQINEKLPSLVDYRVGFQIIDKDDDDTRAVGVAAFVLNGIWLYIPVFFLKGALKGFEILYIKQRDIFVPSMDNWVAALSQRGLSVIGKPLDESRQDNREPFSTPSNTTVYQKSASKYASDGNSLIDEATWKQLCRRLDVNDVGTYRPPDLSSDIPYFGKKAARAFLNTLANEKGFANAMLSVYDIDAVEKIAKSAAGVAIEPDVPSEDSVEFITDKLAEDLSDKERNLVITNGVYVRDNRDVFSQVYHETVDTSVLQNPTCPGIYDILMADGERKPYIILCPTAISERSITDRRFNSNLGRPVALIDIESPKEYLKKKSTEVFCSPADTVSPEAVKGIQGGRQATTQALSALDRGTKVLLVQSPQIVFEVSILNRRRTGEGDSGFQVTVENHRGYEDMSMAPMVRGGDADNTSVVLEFVDAGQRLSLQSGVLYIPEGTRYFTYQCPWKADGRDKVKPGNYATQYTPKDLSLGTSDTVRQQIFKSAGIKYLTIYSSGQLAQIEIGGTDTGLVDKVAALRELTLHHGVHAATAQQLLAQAKAATNNKCAFFIKHAAPYDTDSYGDARVPFMGGPSPREGTGIENSTQALEGQPLTGPRDSDGTMLPHQAIQRAMQSAEAGIKEVFDVSVLKGLIDRADISELRRGYISDMVRGMDRVGRLLLLFYWHQDEFEERYGKDDLQKLEDTLREVFQSQGDLILFLKEKTGYSPDESEAMFGALSEDVAI
jgi:hypothetical protein